MPCQRCKSDPMRTSGPTSAERRCAFDRAGKFTADNWACGTMEALNALVEGDTVSPGTLPVAIYGSDEVLRVIGCDPDADHGWIVLTQYHRRGIVSSALHVGAHTPRILTLGVAITTLMYWQQRKNAVRRDRLSMAPIEARA